MTIREVEILIRQNMALYRNSAKPLTDSDAAIIIGVWADQLADIPAEAGNLAFKRALRVCRFPVTIADIFAQLRSMQTEQEPKTADLWKQINNAAHKAARNKYYYSFTHKIDGISQGKLAAERNRRLFQELPACVQEYFGNLQSLIEFDELDGEAKSFRRRDFEKFYSAWLSEQEVDPAKLMATAKAMLPGGKGCKALNE